MLLSLLPCLPDFPRARKIAGTLTLSHKYKKSEYKDTEELTTQSHSVEIHGKVRETRSARASWKANEVAIHMLSTVNKDVETTTYVRLLF
jgi:hypothetical protein